jgi:hypothetical protein
VRVLHGQTPCLGPMLCLLDAPIPLRLDI